MLTQAARRFSTKYPARAVASGSDPAVTKNDAQPGRSVGRHVFHEQNRASQLHVVQSIDKLRLLKGLAGFSTGPSSLATYRLIEIVFGSVGQH